MSMVSHRLIGGVLLGCALTAACASEGPRPLEQLTRARTLIDAADRGGSAQRYAPADLQRAHDELASANTADSAGKYNAARAYADAAAADANLAAARGGAGEAQHALTAVDQSNASLRSESARATDAVTAMPPPPPPQQ
jgi:hypothetical protein